MLLCRNKPIFIIGKIMSLSPETLAIIKATVPAVAEHAEAITAHFYPLMFTEFPEVKAFFNQSHQQSGTQSKALAGAVVAYAANIENLGVLQSAVERIVNKHVSLDIQPAQYEIVGGCLLKAIKAVLGDAATDEVIAAWGEAYWQLANLLIAAEEEAYQANAAKTGGWRGERSFVVAAKVEESEVITSFYLEPEDGGAVPAFIAGQYLGLVLNINGESTRRNYSLSDAPGNGYLRISVKREEGGMVSNYLHNDVKVGDKLQVLPLAGDFVLADNNKPVILVTGGVGITPIISILHDAIKTGVNGEDILFIQCSRSSDHIILKDELKSLSSSENFSYKQALEVGENADHLGYLNKDVIKKWLEENNLHADGNTAIYFCGPKPFMSALNQVSLNLGFEPDRIHYETFGPSLDI